MNNVVLFCYGKEIEYKRAILSILSLLAWKDHDTPPFKISCFTDNPGYFSNFLQEIEVSFITLSSDKLIDMLDNTSYIHRRKIKVIQEAYQMYPFDNLIFLDSDTFFVKNPNELLAELKPGTSLMHEQEYKFEEAPEIYRLYMTGKFSTPEIYPLAFLDYIKENKFLIDGEETRFYKSQSVWNSGVLGLHNSILSNLSDVLKLNDDVFKHTGWFISEQIAFSLILSLKSSLKPCDQHIIHYHKHKNIMDEVISSQIISTFGDLPRVEKLSTVKVLTKRCQTLVRADLALSIFIGEFKRGNYFGGGEQVMSAIKEIGLDPFLLKLIKRKLVTSK